MRVSLSWNPTMPVQVLAGPEQMPILVVVRDGFELPFAFLNDCPDESLPLEKHDQKLPHLNSRGEVVCGHHAARFDSCTGCVLSNGKAHHTDRLKAGLRPITVDSCNQHQIHFDIDSDLLGVWQRIRTLRFRKSFGRGLVGHCRFLLELLRGLGPSMGNGSAERMD